MTNLWTRRGVLGALTIGATAPALSSCQTNRALGRQQLIAVSDGQLAQMAASSWTQYRQQHKVSGNSSYNSRVRTVGQRIVAVSGLPQSGWEYTVFEDSAINAFVLPGGKVGFNTGILKLMSNDSQLATVMGHEVSHVLGRHAAERYSQGLVSNLALQGAQAGGASAGVAQILGLGLQVGVLLPFSRQHETEADILGIRLMHRAGYNVNEAVTFWEKMAAESRKRGRPPEFLSTHPSDETRIANIRRVIQQLSSIMGPEGARRFAEAREAARGIAEAPARRDAIGGLIGGCLGCLPQSG
ncbi:MAG: M48 family metalloprotease [Alphaproteobacteria bacterium]|nr:M48 family metalloprotease [Alphaproteobacteria bacterium]